MSAAPENELLCAEKVDSNTDSTPIRPQAWPEGWKVLGVAGVLNAVLFGLVLTLGAPGYETNDDLSMQLIASGFYTGHPSEYLVFTNVIIGWVLRALYTFWNQQNWYFVYLVAVHYASLTAIAFVTLSRGRRWLSALLFIGFFLFAEPRILVKLQFTTTAFIAGVAGVLLMADGLALGRRVNLPKTVGGLFFICLTALIRLPVVGFLGLLAGPFLLERLDFKGWRRALAAGSAGLALILALIGIDRWCYQRDPAWAEFREYNALRGDMQHTALGDFLTQAAATVGWTHNDAQMFDNFYYPDPEVYLPVSKLRALHNQLQAAAGQKPFAPRFSLDDVFLPRLFRGDSGKLINLALLTAAACLLVVGQDRRLRLFSVLLGTYGMCVLLGLYLRQTARSPERVSYNLGILLSVVCLYWLASLTQSDSTLTRGSVFAGLINAARRSVLVGLLVAALVVVWLSLYVRLGSAQARSLSFTVSAHRNLKEVSQCILRPVEMLLPQGKHPIIIPLPYNSLLEQSLFFPPISARPSFSLVPYGWLTHSPIFNQALARNQLPPDPAALVGRPDVFFLMDRAWLVPLQTYYREHKGRDVRFDLVLDTDELEDCRACRLRFYTAHTVRGERPVHGYAQLSPGL